MESTNLEYDLIEADQQTKELTISVDYSPQDREDVMNLIELLDSYIEDEETEEN